jgi:hypothetical protein
MSDLKNRIKEPVLDKEPAFKKGSMVRKVRQYRERPWPYITAPISVGAIGRVVGFETRTTIYEGVYHVHRYMFVNFPERRAGYTPTEAMVCLEPVEDTGNG